MENTLAKHILIAKYRKGIRKGELYKDCECLNINAHEMYTLIVNYQIDHYGQSIIKPSRHNKMMSKGVSI